MKVHENPFSSQVVACRHTDKHGKHDMQILQFSVANTLQQ